MSRRVLGRDDLAVGLGMEYLSRRDQAQIWRIAESGDREPAPPMSLESAIELAYLGMTNVADWRTSFKEGRQRR